MAIIEAIETVYLELDTASVTFDSLSGYEHLQIRVSGRHNNAGGGGSSIYIRFNGDTGSNYSTQSMQGYSGTNKNSDFYANQAFVYAGGRISGPLTPDAENYGASIIDIPDYANANKNTALKQMSGLPLDYSSGSYIWFGGSVWDNTAALTSILLYPPSGSFRRGTQISLYGIKSS